MEVLIPAAGLSSRFPSEKPKYMWYDYAGKSMLYKATEPFLGKHNITVGILDEHNKNFDAIDFIKHEFGNEMRIIVLPHLTSGPAETVSQMLDNLNLNLNKELFIKDCDSFFEHSEVGGGYVCTSKLEDQDQIYKVNNKSFVIKNEQNILQKITEKKVISDIFCVGGYKFNTISDFKNGFNTCKQISGELFISQIIQNLIYQGVVFQSVSVTNYTDVGTFLDWKKYNSKPTIFCDIDGTIIKAQARYGRNSYSSTPIKLDRNVSVMLDYQKRGSQIVFATSRPEAAREVTNQMLLNLGFANFQLLMNLNNSARILINDYNESNPFPRAISVNIPRDSDNISDFI